jgi:hypothetical protein
MAIMVFIQLEGSSAATYEVRHEIDGIYKARFVSKPYHSFPQHPEKIILLRSGNDSWTSDCPIRILGLKIGEKIVASVRAS